MPIYEYRCTACARSVEVMHSISGSGPETCEVCGGAMRKALSLPAIVFKGSGWAKKDARSAPASTSASTKDATSGDGTASSTPDGAGSEKGAATSTNTEPASKGPSSSPSGASGTTASGSGKPSSGAPAGSAADRST